MSKVPSPAMATLYEITPQRGLDGAPGVVTPIVRRLLIGYVCDCGGYVRIDSPVNMDEPEGVVEVTGAPCDSCARTFSFQVGFETPSDGPASHRRLTLGRSVE